MLKILICARSESFREVLKEVVQYQYDLILCEIIDQCQEIIRGASIRLVMIDLESQDDPLKKIDQLIRNNPKLKIIVITNNRNVDLAQEAVRLGAVGHAIKPLKLAEIMNIIS